MLNRVNRNLLLINQKSWSLFISNRKYTSLDETNDNSIKILPKSAKVVICGGGLIGTSIAYHLVQLGFKDIVLLTKNK
jgi:shikimate 5-dehydrogenase